MARKVGVINYACFASKEYLIKNSVPQTIQDLLSHRTLNLAQYMPYLKLLVPEVEKAMSLARHSLQTDDMVTLVEATLADGGVAILPSYYEDLYSEICALDGIPIIQVDLFMVYHIRSKERTSIRVLTDWIRDLFESDESGHFGPGWTPQALSPLKSAAS